MDAKPMTTELHHVWITGDGQIFLSKEKAEAHQRLYVAYCEEKTKKEGNK